MFREYSLLITFLLIAWTASAAPQEAEPKPVKLGVIVSLTGDASRNGQNWFEGAQLAADQLKRSGNPVELIVEDDATAPAKLASAFVKLATVDKVAGIVGGTWDFLAETAFPLAKQYRVPFITPTNPVEIFSASAQSNPWVFTNGLSLGAERKALCDFLLSKQIRRIGLVYVNVPYGISHAELVRATAKELALPIVTDSEISYQGFRDSIRVAALKASKEKPDLVFVVLNFEGVDLLLRDFEQRQFSPQVLMTHTLKEAFDFGGSAMRYQRAFGIFPRFASLDFENAFRRKFGRTPYDYAAAGFDATRFMFKLAQQKFTIPAEAVVSYHGITGEHKLSPSTRSVVETEAVILRIVDGDLRE